MVRAGLDVGQEADAFGGVHGGLLSGAGGGSAFSAKGSIFNEQLPSLRLSGELAGEARDLRVPLRSIRYLWKFHFGLLPVILAISCR
jgi:hypothetical protein